MTNFGQRQFDDEHDPRDKRIISLLIVFTRIQKRKSLKPVVYWTGRSDPRILILLFVFELTLTRSNTLHRSHMAS